MYYLYDASHSTKIVPCVIRLRSSTTVCGARGRCASPFGRPRITGISYNKNSATAPPLHFVRGKINSISLHLFLFLLLRNFVAQPLATLGVTNNCYTQFLTTFRTHRRENILLLKRIFHSCHANKVCSNFIFISKN